MTNNLKLLDSGNLTSLDEALAELENYQPSTPRQEPTTKKTKSNQAINSQDYILLEGTDNYPDTLISTTSTLQNNSWYETHERLHEQGFYMPTIKQFVDFLKLLKSGNAFNEQGSRVPLTQLEQIFNEITELRTTGPLEVLDAKFEGINGVFYMNYNHKIINGQLQPQNAKILQSYVIHPNTTLGKILIMPVAKLEYWLNNSTPEGLTPSNITDGDRLYNCHIGEEDSIVAFATNAWTSGPGLIFGITPNSISGGVRHCKPKYQ